MGGTRKVKKENSSKLWLSISSFVLSLAEWSSYANGGHEFARDEAISPIWCLENTIVCRLSFFFLNNACFAIRRTKNRRAKNTLARLWFNAKR